MLALSACNEDFGDWKQQATNTQGATVTFGEGSVSAVDVIDFAEIEEGTQLVQVCTLVAPTTSIEASKLKYTINLDGTEFPLNDDGTMSYPDFKAFVESTYGKAPKVNDIIAKVNAFIGNESTKVRYTSEGFFVKAKPDAPFIDAGGYYLVGDFYKTSESNGWDVVGAHKFSQIGGGDVYKNPTFTITVEVKATEEKTSDWYWKIIPANNYEGDFWKEGKDGVVGTIENGDPSFEGALTTSSPQAGRIKEPGLYKFTIDMMNYKYTIEAVNYATYIWIAGNGNGWGSPADPMATVNYDGVYEGMAYIDGAFKFRSQESNWDAPDWGQGASLGTLAEGAGDINKESEFASGFYMLKADLAAMTYEAVAVNSITMVGTHNGWNQADEATHMTYDVAQKCWTIDYTFTDDAMVKFAMNDSWDISWGGADGDASNYGNLTCDSGKDLNVAAGTYHVKLYLKCEGKNYVEFVPAN